MKARSLVTAALVAGGMLASSLPASAAGSPPPGHRYGKAPRGSVRAALVQALYAPRYADVTVGSSVRAVKAHQADPSADCPAPVLAHRQADQAAVAQTHTNEKLSLAVASESAYRTPALAAKAFRAQLAELRCSMGSGDRMTRHVYRGRRAAPVSEVVLTGGDASGGANLKGVVVVDLAGPVLVVVSRLAEDAQEIDVRLERVLALRLARLGATRGFAALVRAA